MSDWAQFWAIDLHTHTPASKDVTDDYGGETAADFVRAAIDAGLDAVAVTDHNTTAWCDLVAAEASGTALIVLPGVEISTSDGHLLAVFEEGTPSSKIDEVLVRLGIGKDDQGKLDIAATVGFQDAAIEVAKAHGLAIAAHIDRPKGLLQLPVPATQKRILGDQALCAVEIVDLTTQEAVDAKLAGSRQLACVRGSDMSAPAIPYHVLAGIGRRRTWVKAGRPDLVGIRHALEDPELRIRLQDPESIANQHPVVESVRFIGGFLDGSQMRFSPDLNCLLGGTGAGKSLAIEAIRYALDQQVDSVAFPAISTEVRDRLRFALGYGSVVRLQVSAGGQTYQVERIFDEQGDSAATVSQQVGADWATVATEPGEVVTIDAFSQGEVLEYARAPVGRMALIDRALDLDDITNREGTLIGRLRANAGELIEMRREAASLRQSANTVDDLAEQVRDLSTFFEKDVVQKQDKWTADQLALQAAHGALPAEDKFVFDLKISPLASRIEESGDLFDRTATVRTDLSANLDGHLSRARTSISEAREQLGKIYEEWDARFETFKGDLNSELSKLGDGSNLVVLRAKLEQLQKALAAAKHARERLDAELLPKFETARDTREELLVQLKDLRDERRMLRRDRVDLLNKKAGSIVKLDVSAYPDHAAFRESLNTLKVGSRVRDEVLEAISSRIHPFRFVREIFNDTPTALVDEAKGIDAASVSRLYSNVDERDLWAELFEAQICDCPDRLDMKFRKPDDGQYTPIEQLAHGQKCTAVLVALLIDGEAPVVIDQPEDALHAPWIEEYLVDRLRALRGSRQYIFATRSPGIVVSADAEQIITMKADAGRGAIEATGSLERHDLNMLALHHLEGGAEAFQRRSVKLRPSVGSG